MARASTDIISPVLARPVLHLSGPKLRAALEQLIVGAESVGGVERFAEAVKLRGEVFQDRLLDGKATALSRAAFDELVTLMPTVRQRVGKFVDAVGWAGMRSAIAVLLHDAHVPGTADQRIAAFECALSFPSSRVRGEGRPQASSPTAAPRPNPLPAKAGRGDSHRFLRDLAAELLHGCHPEHYPLMTRWVWDAGANTGALREIWHDAATGSDEVDRIVIDVPDTHEAFLALREELAQFLSDNGIFRNVLWYGDLLLAQVYAIYINAQGGAYLKGDFQAVGDPLEHTRRMLGLDRLDKRGMRRSALAGVAMDSDVTKRLA